MIDIKSEIDIILKTVVDITSTANDVNRHSINRKEISTGGLSLITTISEKNNSLRENFDKIHLSLNTLLEHIGKSSDEFKANIDEFLRIISELNIIKKTLTDLSGRINRLTTLVEVIREDTDEIFTLALNASIVSSKYSHTSSVFDILANKLNEMSNFISLNLENIVKVVVPITKGIDILLDMSSIVVTDVDKGYKDIQSYPNIMTQQKSSTDELLINVESSKNNIDSQKGKVDSIHDMIQQMDQDAEGSIGGSANVRKIGEGLQKEVASISENFTETGNYLAGIKNVQEESISIWKSAMNVNEKSKSQLNFSLSSVDFCDSMLSESSELMKTIEIFTNQSIANTNMANTISTNVENISSELNVIGDRINSSTESIDKFNEDYSQIDNILGFLKDILKSMNVIGMLSRIESSRDPDEFAGFIQISENIVKLQEKIQENIPVIEDNIINTHSIIDNLNDVFNNILNIFPNIQVISQKIISELNEIKIISSDSENFSRSILVESEEIVKFLNDLKSSLIELSDVVKKPIEGSAANIERGKFVEKKCKDIVADYKEEI